MKNGINSYWSQVEKTESCWLWAGGKVTGGYGQISIGGKNYRAHRLAWELANNSPPPPGLQVCHRCDNPSCVNPAHLFVGTAKDNAADMVAKGRCKSAGPPGVRNGRAKLDDYKIIQLRNRRADGATYQELADSFGVSLRTAYKAVNSLGWNHVPQ